MARILICDDTIFMRTILKRILTQRNLHEIAGEAENGLVLTQKYDIVKPDLVLLDVSMPVMDGLTALKEIKKKHPDAAVVMCSAMGQPDIIHEAMQNGALDFIIKPFTPVQVIDTIDRALKYRITQYMNG